MVGGCRGGRGVVSRTGGRASAGLASSVTGRSVGRVRVEVSSSLEGASSVGRVRGGRGGVLRSFRPVLRGRAGVGIKLRGFGGSLNVSISG